VADGVKVSKSFRGRTPPCERGR